MNDSRMYGLLGFANRARQLVSGTFAVEKCVKQGKARLVLLDETASRNTQDAIAALCAGRAVPLRKLPEGALEKILGDCRICAAVTDENFVAPLLKELS